MPTHLSRFHAKFLSLEKTLIMMPYAASTSPAAGELLQLLPGCYEK
jgi:hypothetical protein